LQAAVRGNRPELMAAALCGDGNPPQSS